MRPLGASDPVKVGPYRMLAELGRGGMGRVFLGSGPDGRLVALKQVHPQFTVDEGFRARFRREVAASRLVSGAYTAAVIDADPDARIPWLASVFVPGPALSDVIGAAGVLPPDAALRLAAGLAAALTEIHRAGLVHRDLKPANVLLAADGPRVIDFGIARATDGGHELTGTGWLVGSPQFMSPEQAEGRELTPASDMFSLGCVVVLACTGASPFAGPSAPRILYNIVHAEPDLATVPIEVHRVIKPCLARDPAARPTSAQLLAAIGELAPSARPWPPAVHRLIAQQETEIARVLDPDPERTAVIPLGAIRPGHTMVQPPQSAPQPPTPPPVPAPARRRAGMIALGAFGAVLVVVVVVAVLYGASRNQQTAGATQTDTTTTTTQTTTTTTTTTTQPTTTTTTTQSTTPSAAPAGPPTGLIKAGVAAGFCLDVAGANTVNGTPIQLYQCNGSAAQQWTEESDGTLRAFGKCMDATGGNTDNGTKIQLYDCNGTPAQVWQPQPNGALRNTKSGRCLDDPQAAVANWTQLQLHDCNGTPAQVWSAPGPS